MRKITKELKEQYKLEIKDLLDKRIIEDSNAKFLEKLIEKAESVEELLNIKALGTRYQRTGFHFDVRLEKTQDEMIKYFEKDEKLSFDNGGVTHRLIIGDNYPALLNLLITHRNKIKLIYIDPPYSKDSMGEFAKTNYDNAITRDNLLSMLYTRLSLAKELLRDDGVIFCSIDDRNQAYVKCLFDEVFGEGNFISNIIWKKIEENSSSGGTMKVTKTFRRDHEYILCYSKQNGMFLTNKIMELPNFENEYKNLDNDPRGAFKAGAITMKGNKNSSKYYEITTPSGKKHARVWRITKEEFLELDRNNRIYYGKKGDSVPQIKIFINEERPVTPTTFLENLGSAYSSGKILNEEIFGLEENEQVFSNPKPNELIKHLLKISTTPANNGGGGTLRIA